MRFRRFGRMVALALAATSVGGAAWGQAKSEIKITRQPSIIYMPTHIMEAEKLVEKHAAALGVPNLKVEWITFSGGGNSTDALLAGSIDVVNTGMGNMLLLWDRTRGGVKGIVATCAEPLTLVTREARIKTLADIRPTDRIAVPTVKVSTQAILLQIAAAKMFGPTEWAHFDSNTVQLGHPDAAASLANPNGEIASHFSAPPFVYTELKSVPGAHVVTDARGILGSPLTVAMFFATSKFADQNPKVVQAIYDATVEALALIKSDTRRAVELYRTASGDKMSTDDLLDMLKAPDMMAFNPAPEGAMAFATHMHTVGLLKTEAKDWKDFFFPVAHGLAGN